MKPQFNTGYVAAAEIAAVCEMGESSLDNRFRPDAWAMPRDFDYQGKHFRRVYAVASLPQLVDALLAGGASDAGLRLREWLKERATRGPAPAATVEEENKLVDVQRVAAGPDELDAAVAKLGRRHASDREASPAGWAKTWEDNHE